MKRLNTLCLAALAWAPVLTGCHANFSNPTPAALSAQRELTAAQRSFDAYWRASLDVLRSYEFQLDRQDRRAGVITTRPMLARQFFEVWRRDAVTYYDMTESTIQSMYNTVTVQLVPGDQAGVYEPKVTVALERLNRPSEGPPSFVAGMALVNLSVRKEAKRTSRETTAPEPERTEVGRNEALARRLENEIRAKAAHRLGRPAPGPVRRTKPAGTPRPPALPK